MVYKQVKIDITKKQLEQACKGKPVRFAKDQIGSGSHYLSLHPMNVKVVEKAAMKGTGCVLHMAPGELMTTADAMKGSGFFDSVWSFLKSNATPLLDIVQNVAKPFVGEDIANAGRDLVRNITGKGVKKTTKASRKAMLQGKGLYMS